MNENIQDQEALNDLVRDWLASLDEVLEQESHETALYLLKQLEARADAAGIDIPFTANTPYINSIHHADQPIFPGSREIERRIKSIIRWNAMAMVVRANRGKEAVGGHISTYASAATLYEVGFNHFFRCKTEAYGGDQVYFQGHAAPGMYARAFLEGRLSEEMLANFRNELNEKGGLSSYPHPRLMPDFWEFPTVSMGLGPLQAIYAARFNRYLEDRGLKPANGGKVWCFVGDGETDEPETLGAITLASREGLDNLIFVVNCNLQRLDGPVRGNGKIIQELEAIFRGAGWNVIKVIWGTDWDPLLARDDSGVLVRRMGEVVDGDYQKYTVESGAYIREHFFGKDPKLLALVKHMTDEQLRKLTRGGHDPQKVYAAFHEAWEHTGAPTVILAKTIKGYGMGESGEGKNITHQQKKMNEDEMRNFRTRFGIPISDEDVAFAPFYKPAPNAPEIAYLHQKRQELGGYLPKRNTVMTPFKGPDAALFEEFKKGTEDRAVSTTMVLVRVMTKLLSDKNVGDLIVPIVPDEARTFGMEPLFRQVGIYAHKGQLYEPVDRDNLLYYKEAKDGQILEEGITEAGAISSFIAAGTAYATHGINTIPFFTYYSMFGMQRVGDLVWLCGDIRCKGFLVGGTAGRTTLSGEGLQHQDGHSLLNAYAVPSLVCYDPAFAFEIAIIIKDGIRRMYEEGESVFYYITVENDPYPMPPMPEGVEEGVLKGMYKFSTSKTKGLKHRVQLFASGAIMNEALEAQRLLESYGVAADIWSITSYKELHQDGLATARWNMLHPDQTPRKSYIEQCVEGEEGPCVMVSDYVKALPESIQRWFPNTTVTLGTDGFGRSDTRAALRNFFEVDSRYITLAAMYGLLQDKKIKTSAVNDAINKLDIDPEKPNPVTV